MGVRARRGGLSAGGHAHGYPESTGLEVALCLKLKEWMLALKRAAGGERERTTDCADNTDQAVRIREIRAIRGLSPLVCNATGGFGSRALVTAGLLPLHVLRQEGGWFLVGAAPPGFTVIVALVLGLVLKAEGGVPAESRPAGRRG